MFNKNLLEKCFEKNVVLYEIYSKKNYSDRIVFVPL
jgi:hypothetical protein